MEILTFSAEQLNVQTDRFDKWNQDATVTLLFYNGVQFTDRRLKGEEKSPFEDAELIYEGVVDETKTTYKEESMYSVYADNRYILEERNESEDEDDDSENYPDDGLGGMDKSDLAVARLDAYYSRNNIKTNLDDDDED